MTERHQELHVEWAKSHLNTDWSCYLFGNEKKFNLGRVIHQMWKREKDGPAVRTEFKKGRSVNM